MPCDPDVRLVVVNETAYPLYVEPAFSTTFDGARVVGAGRAVERADLARAYSWDGTCRLEVRPALYVLDRTPEARADLDHAVTSAASLFALDVQNSGRVVSVPIGTCVTESGFLVAELSTDAEGAEVVLRVRYDPITFTGALMVGIAVALLAAAACAWGYLALHSQIRTWESAEIGRRIRHDPLKGI